MASTFRRRGQKKTPTESLSSPAASAPTASSRLASISPRVVLKGTKPWSGGITITSTGLRDWDSLLLGSSSAGGGGGQPLGTCIWLEEDRWTRSLALCLIKYWCAEAVSHEQILFVPIDCEDEDHEEETTALLSAPPTWTAAISGDDDDDTARERRGRKLVARSEINELLMSLPRNLHLDKERAANSTTKGENDTNNNSNSHLGTLQEENEEDDDDEYSENAETADEGLKNAWQYRKDVQQQLLGQTSSTNQRQRKKSASASDEFCHSFDLNGRLADQLEVNSLVEIDPIPLSSCCSTKRSCLHRDSSCGIRYFRAVIRRIKALLTSRPNSVLRLLLYHNDLVLLKTALPLILAYIRSHVLPVVVLVAVQPWAQGLSSSALLRSLPLLQRTCDVVLETEGFASRRVYPPPPEFSAFAGLLKIRKVSTVTAATAHGGGGHFADMTVSKRPAADLYGLKRDRRKLHIQLLHIPPEDFAGDGSVGAGGARSGAGRKEKTSNSNTPTSSSSGGVGCGSGGGNSPLDF